MAFVKKSLTNTEWTLILSGVANATFQNSGSYPIYINFSTAANTVPSDEVGLIYNTHQGELIKAMDQLTPVVGANQIWAKAFSPVGSVIVDE